jgi:hypothetical protein
MSTLFNKEGQVRTLDITQPADSHIAGGRAKIQTVLSWFRSYFVTDPSLPGVTSLVLPKENSYT